MKSERWTSIGPLALTLCLLPGCSRVAAQSVPGQAKESTEEQVSVRLPAISGHVYRADTGAPLARAVVTLYPPFIIGHANFRHAETEADGSYRFYDVRPNGYTAVAACEGFVTHTYSRDDTLTGPFLTVNPEKTHQNIDFHLALAGIISGSLVDEHDKAVGKIEVSAVRFAFSPGGVEFAHRLQVTQTDEHGNFRLAGLEPGLYYVCVNGPYGNTLPNQTGESYRETYYGDAASRAGAQQVRVLAGDEARDIRISVRAEKRYSITVRISEPGSKGVPSRYKYQVDVEGRNHSSSIGDDGSFTIPDIPSGDYTLVVSTWGTSTFVGQATAAVRVVDRDVQVNVQAGGLGEASGKAVVVGSQTISFAGVRLFMRSQEGALNVSVFDASGRFAMKRVLPGHYTFELAGPVPLAYLKQVRCSGRDYTRQPITIEAGQVLADCEIALSADTGGVQGLVVGNKHASDLMVVLIPKSIELRKVGRYTLVAKTASDGSFAIPNVIPGDYLLFAVPQAKDHYYFAVDFADRNRSEARRVSVKPRQTQVVELVASEHASVSSCRHSSKNQGNATVAIDIAVGPQLHGFTVGGNY